MKIEKKKGKEPKDNANWTNNSFHLLSLLFLCKNFLIYEEKTERISECRGFVSHSEEARTVHCPQHMSFRKQLLFVLCRDSRSKAQQLVSM